jgi:hypothetical protein
MQISVGQFHNVATKRYLDLQMNNVDTPVAHLRPMWPTADAKEKGSDASFGRGAYAQPR